MLTVFLGCRDSIHHAQVPRLSSLIAEEAVSLGESCLRRWIQGLLLKEAKWISCLERVQKERIQTGISSGLFLPEKVENVTVFTGLSSAGCVCRPLASHASRDSRLVLVYLFTGSELQVPEGKTHCFTDAEITLTSKETTPVCYCKVFSKDNPLISNCQVAVEKIFCSHSLIDFSAGLFAGGNHQLGGGSPGYLPTSRTSCEP